MRRKLHALLALPLILAAAAYAGQERLTTHRVYYGVADGHNSIYYMLGESDDGYSIWKMDANSERTV